MFKNILRFFVELYQLSMLDKATLHQYLHQLETSPCEGCAEMLTEVHSMLPQSVGGRSGKVEIKVYSTSSIWNFMYGVYHTVI